jgi:soluble cytochrome b562
VEFYERDVTMLIREFQPDLEPVLAELSNHMLESDLSEVRSIIVDIQQRIEQTKRRFSEGEERGKR